MRATPEGLAAAIRIVLEEVSAEGSLVLPVVEISDPRVEHSRNHNHGDRFINMAMQLARKAGTKPHDLAELLVPCLEALDGTVSVEAVGPGFLNIRLDAASTDELARSIVEVGEAYGRNDSLSGQHINLEYVSANPTGPAHLGGARRVAVGDSPTRILSACGARVAREYYLNDHGIQVDRFARSLLASARDQETPEGGYGGTYISEIARQVTADKLAAGHPDPATPPDTETIEVFRSRGVDLMLAAVKAELHAFRSDLDVFLHEDFLYTSGVVECAIARLRERGVIEERDGAIWLCTTDFGDDKDRVLIKPDGNAVYLVANLVYYLDKRERGADRVTYLLGADHHGYIGRMMTMCAAFGDTPGTNVQILIGQFVDLAYNGVPVCMSKRAGTTVTLEDLIDAVGADAVRYVLARPSMDPMIDIGLNLLTSSTSDNPVYYAQYAHTRTRNVVRNAAERGVSHDPNETPFEPGALDDPIDTVLLGVLVRPPATVAQAAQLREQHRVARCLEQPAAAYRAWHGVARVIPRGDDAVGSGYVACPWFNDAVGQVLANGLDLLGVGTPEKI